MCYVFLNLLKQLGNGAEATETPGTTEGASTAFTNRTLEVQ